MVSFSRPRLERSGCCSLVPLFRKRGIEELEYEGFENEQKMNPLSDLLDDIPTFTPREPDCPFLDDPFLASFNRPSALILDSSACPAQAARPIDARPLIKRPRLADSNLQNENEKRNTPTLSLPLPDLSTGTSSWSDGPLLLFPTMQNQQAKTQPKPKPQQNAQPKPARHAIDLVKPEQMWVLNKYLGWTQETLRAEWEAFTAKHRENEALPDDFVTVMRPSGPCSDEATDPDERFRKSLLVIEDNQEVEHLFQALNSIFGWRQHMFKLVQRLRPYTRLSLRDKRHGINCWLAIKIFP